MEPRSLGPAFDLCCENTVFCCCKFGVCVTLHHWYSKLDVTITDFIDNYNQLNMFRAIFSPILRNTRLCLQLVVECTGDAACWWQGWGVFCVHNVVSLMGHIHSPVCCSYSCEEFIGTIRFAGFILLTFSAWMFESLLLFLRTMWLNGPTPLILLQFKDISFVERTVVNCVCTLYVHSFLVCWVADIHTKHVPGGGVVSKYSICCHW